MHARSEVDPFSGVARHIRARPWTALVVFLAATTPIYQVFCRVSLYEPFAVRPSVADASIPLLPWTAVPYLTWFGLLPSVVALGQRSRHFAEVLLTGFLCIATNLTVNVLVPTQVVPRLGPEAAPGTLLALILAGDGALCALPSGHVSLPVALSVAAWRAGWRGWPAYAVWGAVLFVCTLTTGQHYLIDAVAGVGWGLLVGGLGGAWIARTLRGAP